MLGHLLKPECEELIRKKDWESLRLAFEEVDPADIAEILEDLPPEDAGVIFRFLPRSVAGVTFRPPARSTDGDRQTLGATSFATSHSRWPPTIAPGSSGCREVTKRALGSSRSGCGWLGPARLPNTAADT